MSAPAIRLLAAQAALAAGLAVAVGPAVAADAVHRLHIEPGFRMPQAQLLIPVTAVNEQGAFVLLSRAAPTCQIAGEPVEIVDLVEPVATAVLIISDQFLVAPAWSSTPLVAPASPHWLGIWDASQEPIPHVALQPAAGLAPAAMPAPHVPRLWDALLAGIRELAVLPSIPVRRVILVIGDLREEDASAHPMAACLEAAVEVAIPIHAVVIDGADPQAVERLRHLAEATGGSLQREVSAVPALLAGLARIGAAGGLIVHDPGGPLPLAATVTAHTGAPAAHTRIVARPRGRYTPGAGLVTAAAVLLAAAGGWTAWRLWRRRPVGYLVGADPAHPWCRAIPAAGLTIGRTPNNGLHLAENRVSKHHALVRWHRGQIQLIDLRSTNGTQINDRPVRSAALAEGDTIVFGDAVTVQFRRRAPQSRDRT